MEQYLSYLVIGAAIVLVLGTRGKSKKRKRGLIGVSRWDLWYGGWDKQEIHGYLKNFPDLAPWFATKDKRGRLHIDHNKTAQNVEEETRLAQEAGVNFFIFYAPAREATGNGWKLDHALRAYLPIAHKYRVGFVQALFGAYNYKCDKRYLDESLKELGHRLKHGRWQEYQGRPIFVVLRPKAFKRHMSYQHLTDSIRATCDKAGRASPIIIGMELFRTIDIQDELLAGGFDDIADYSPCDGGTQAVKGKGNPYKQDTAERLNTLKRFKGGLVRSFNLGFHPLPRFQGKNQKFHHALLPVGNEMINRIRKTVGSKINIIGNWNEFSESLSICPTRGGRHVYNQFKKALK